MNTKKKFNWLHAVTCVTAATALVAFAMPQAEAQSSKSQGRNGTTLAASKTLDICVVDDFTWRFSGLISVWNEGAIETQGLNIVDHIQNIPADTSGKFEDVYNCGLSPETPIKEIAGYTFEPDATVFKYLCEAAPLDGDIRNSVVVTITNHSGSLGVAKGPNPKATWAGGTPPACEVDCGCALTHGFWKTHPNWPANGPDPDEVFYNNGLGKTWAQMLDEKDKDLPSSNNYVKLARQYIAAELNKANGACAPEGFFSPTGLLAAARSWFESEANTIASCTATRGQPPCGTQNTWAASLDNYNNNDYEGAPEHCG